FVKGDLFLDKSAGLFVEYALCKALLVVDFWRSPKLSSAPKESRPVLMRACAKEFLKALRRIEARSIVSNTAPTFVNHVDAVSVDDWPSRG
ncbi:MAG: hypothetical protein AAF267_21725, partial [Deinococcota bacterium]